MTHRFLQIHTLTPYAGALLNRDDSGLAKRLPFGGVLRSSDPGADTIQETELTSGLYYGYVAVDVPGLLANLQSDVRLAGAVLHNLVYLIAEVSPGAKLGSTAPYARASLVLLEAGDRQPRSLAEAFREPAPPRLGAAAEALAAHLGALDVAYATGETRRATSLADVPMPAADRVSLAELAAWARTLPGEGTTP